MKQNLLLVLVGVFCGMTLVKAQLEEESSPLMMEVRGEILERQMPRREAVVEERASWGEEERDLTAQRQLQELDRKISCDSSPEIDAFMEEKITDQFKREIVSKLEKEGNEASFQQEEKRSAAIVAQRKRLVDFEKLTSENSMELRANLLTTSTTGQFMSEGALVDTTSQQVEQKGIMSFDQEGRDVSVTIHPGRGDQELLRESLKNRAEQSMKTGKVSDPSEMMPPSIDHSTTISTPFSKLKLLQNQFKSYERSYKITNSGLEIAIDDLEKDDPERAVKIAALHEKSYLSMKENLEKTLSLMTENSQDFQDRGDAATLLGKLAIRTIEIAIRSVPPEKFNFIEDDEGSIIKMAADNMCFDLVRLVNVVNASKAEIGTKLHNCQLEIAKRDFLIVSNKFRYAHSLSSSKTETSPEALAQAKEKLEAITPFFNAKGETLFKIKASVPIADPYEARRAAIHEVINLARSASTIANDLKIMVSL